MSKFLEKLAEIKARIAASEQQPNAWYTDDKSFRDLVDTVCDSAAAFLAYGHFSLIWARLIDNVETKGEINWREVVIASHPAQLAKFDQMLLHFKTTDELPFKLTEFRESARWLVDTDVPKDIVFIEVAGKIGAITHLSMSGI